jgi:hypothetical protein
MRRLSTERQFMKSDSLPFSVEIWSKDGQALEETISASANFMLAKAAYKTAQAMLPNDRILQRERARVIAERLPEKAQ